MAREYFPAYHSYLEQMEELNDAERGRLFTACLLYSMTGEAQKLSGNERFVFPAFRSQIDRDAQKYEGKSKANSANANKRWGANSTNDMQKHANACDCMRKDAKHAKEKAKEKAKENHPLPLSPSPAMASGVSAPTAQIEDDDDDVMMAARLSRSLDALSERWKATGGSLNAASYDAMERLIADYEEQDILEAMQTAHRYGKGGSWAYVETVLKNWQEKGKNAQPGRKAVSDPYAGYDRL